MEHSQCRLEVESRKAILTAVQEVRSKMPYSNSIFRETLKYFARSIGPSAMLRKGFQTAYSAARIFAAMGSRVLGSAISRAWNFRSMPALRGMMWK